MSEMKSEETLRIGGRFSPDPLSIGLTAVELELALDFQKAEQSFRKGVEWAAASVGGEVLFEIPAEGQMEDATRLCAVRIPARDAPGPPTILFVLLGRGNPRVRVVHGHEAGDRLYAFAKAYAGLLDRLNRNNANIASA